MSPLKIPHFTITVILRVLFIYQPLTVVTNVFSRRQNSLVSEINVAWHIS